MEGYLTLVRRAKTGSAEAFAELYREIYKDMYRFACYTLKNTHDAEDAVSDAVTDAWVGIASLRSEESFRGWIFRILSNKCRRRLKEYADKLEELPEELPGENRDATQTLDVREAFGRLEAQERMILSLHIFGGYTSREIAETLEMKDATVRSRQKRALEKMERYLR